MKSAIRVVLTGLAAACFALPALAAEQSAASGASEQASQAWNDIRSYSVDKKNEAVAYGKKLLKQSDTEIAKLDADAGKASGAAKDEWKKQMANLKTARTQAAAKLERMEKAGGSAWNDAKDGFADAYRDLRGAYDRAVGHATKN